MRTVLFISPDYAPALGDIRELWHGDVVYLRPGATDRYDWSRYADALTTAITRGADVRHAS